jgi:hypothetical protein
MSVPRIAICCLLGVITVGASLFASDAPTPMNERIRVHLRDGRSISGQLDPRTSNEHLWIQTSEAGIVARSGFRWDIVQNFVHNDQTLTPHEFRKLITPASFEPPSTVETASTPCLKCNSRSAETGTHPAVVVRSLDIRAGLANWDSDVEPDGLLVEVIPRDEWGSLAPINGQIVFTLIAENTPDDPQELYRPRARYPEIARTSSLVRDFDFIDGAPVYKVPFGVALPDFRFDLAPHAVLTATLGVPGQGTFQASDDEINLRPGNWIRDRRQQFFGTRYFRQEGAAFRR